MIGTFGIEVAAGAFPVHAVDISPFMNVETVKAGAEPRDFRLNEDAPLLASETHRALDSFVSAGSAKGTNRMSRTCFDPGFAS